MALVTKQHLRVQLKRAYAPASPEDGVRVLVDRLWPRGLRKSEAAIDRWVKDVAPSTKLRRWFGHDPSRWVMYGRRPRCMYGRRPRCKRNLTISEAFGCGHVWTAPAVQEESDYQRSVRVRSCIRPLNAAVWPLALM
jgi:hypothetical protein